MIQFKTIAYDRTGNALLIQLSIEPESRTGVLLWGEEKLTVQSAYPDPENNWLNCEIKWPSELSRSVITLMKSNGQDFLSIRIFGNPFNYRISPDAKSQFVNFIAELDNALTFDITDPSTAFDLESLLDMVQLSSKNVCIYIGSNIYKNLELKFTQVSVNGEEYKVERMWPLPQGLGFYIELDRFDVGEELEIKYSFNTGIVSYGASVGVGVFYNRLRNRQFIQKHDIESLESYKGEGIVTVKEKKLGIEFDEGKVSLVDSIPEEDLASDLICEIQYKRLTKDPIDVGNGATLIANGQTIAQLKLSQTENKAEAKINLTKLELGSVIKLGLNSWIYNISTNLGDTKTQCKIVLKRGKTTVIKEKYVCRNGVYIRNVSDLWSIQT